MAGRGGGFKKQGGGSGGSERREGRGGRGSNRGGSGWGKDRNSWGAQPAAPPPVVEEVADTDPTPITCADGFQYPQMTEKVAAALRSLRNPGEVDDRTRPILEKWEEKVRIALKMGTVIPTPPNWRAAAPRSGGGWGTATPPVEAGGSSRVAETFLASAAKTKHKPGKQHQHHSKKANFDAPPNLQNDPRLKEKIFQQNTQIMQQHQKLLRQHEQLEEAFQAANERLMRRDAAIQKMQQYLGQLTDKVPMLDTYNMIAPESYGGGYQETRNQEAWQQPRHNNPQMMTLQKKA